MDISLIDTEFQLHPTGRRPSVKPPPDQSSDGGDSFIQLAKEPLRLRLNHYL